jgi:two-component system, NtrC family, response regulator AtoC
LSDPRRTHRPGSAPAQPTALEVLVYVRQRCIVFPLPENGVVRAGRGANNDLCIDDPSVSRLHFLLHIGDGIEVEDLGSANGTSVFSSEADPLEEESTQRNESEARLAPTQRRRLRPGDFIRAGVALVVVQATSAAGPRAVSALSSRPPSDASPLVLLDPEMKRAYEIAVRAAQSGISVLITGETGAGKEIFAETIHLRSNRRSRPLLRLNCAAMPEALLESELFGHERGAFTGATQTKVGLLESNDQGTVFLDEIGEMPLSTQAKLLRVLEEKTILRVGATKPRAIDVRFIWATNRDLRAEARAGRFRQDLYFRIAGVEFSIPPLRRRPSEIEPLARMFLERFCHRSGLPLPELTPEAVDALHRYSWPGNVRELKNVMERAPFLCAGARIEATHVPTDGADENGLFPAEETETTEVFLPRGAAAKAALPPLPSSIAPATGLRLKNEDAERALIGQALEQCAGNQTRAARLLGVSRRTLINHLERLNMPRPKKA